MKVLCNYCGSQAECVPGEAIYGNRAVAKKMFWRCVPCSAWVGCHGRGAWIMNSAGDKVISDGTLPLGTLAKVDLRRARKEAHDAFDPLWHNANVSRRVAYQWLAHALRIPFTECHMSLFDLERCQEVVRLCTAPNNRFQQLFPPRKAA